MRARLLLLLLTVALQLGCNTDEDPEQGAPTDSGIDAAPGAGGSDDAGASLFDATSSDAANDTADSTVSRDDGGEAAPDARAGDGGSAAAVRSGTPDQELAGYACGYRGNADDRNTLLDTGGPAIRATFVGSDRVLTERTNGWTLWSLPTREVVVFKEVALNPRSNVPSVHAQFLGGGGEMFLSVVPFRDGTYVFTPVQVSDGMPNRLFTYGIGPAPWGATPLRNAWVSPDGLHYWTSSTAGLNVFNFKGLTVVQQGDFSAAVAVGNAEAVFATQGASATKNLVIRKIPYDGSSATTSAVLTGSPRTWFDDASHLVTSEPATGRQVRVYDATGQLVFGPSDACVGLDGEAFYGVGDTFVCSGGGQVYTIDLGQGVNATPVPVGRADDTRMATRCQDGLIRGTTHFVVSSTGVTTHEMSSPAPGYTRLIGALGERVVFGSEDGSLPGWVVDPATTADGRLGCGAMKSVKVSRSGLIAVETGSGSALIDGTSGKVAQFFNAPLTLGLAGDRVASGDTVYQLGPTPQRLGACPDFARFSPDFSKCVVHAPVGAAAAPLLLADGLTGQSTQQLGTWSLTAADMAQTLIRFSDSGRTLGIGQFMLDGGFDNIRRPGRGEIYVDGALTYSSPALNVYSWLSDDLGVGQAGYTNSWFHTFDTKGTIIEDLLPSCGLGPSEDIVALSPHDYFFLGNYCHDETPTDTTYHSSGVGLFDSAGVYRVVQATPPALSSVTSVPF